MMTAALTVLASLLGAASPAASTVPSVDSALVALAGHWKGDSRIVVNWTKQRRLSADLVIHPDGRVEGVIGDARLVGGRIRRNRGALLRAMHFKTDYIITGKLSGPVIGDEQIVRSAVSVPLDRVADTLRGGIHTTGTNFGGAKSMMLSSAALELHRVPPDR